MLKIFDYIDTIDCINNDYYNVSLISENEKVYYSEEINGVCNEHCLNYFKFL